VGGWVKKPRLAKDGPLGRIYFHQLGIGRPEAQDGNKETLEGPEMLIMVPAKGNKNRTRLQNNPANQEGSGAKNMF